MALSSKRGTGQRGQVTVSFSDSINLIRDQLHWTPKGVRLLTKWSFAEGTEIEFAFDHAGERHCCSGIVVACRPLEHPEGCFDTVIFFVETPCQKLQKAACDCRLQTHPPEDETHFTLNNDVLTGSVSNKSLNSAMKRRSGPGNSV
jgi:hypothetical protein